MDSPKPERSACVLVVDDDELIRELLEARLTSRGYRVVLAAGGEEARQKMQAEKPDLVVCDVVMPGEDGLSFCRSMRAQKDKTPCLFLTAKGQPRDIVEVLSAGADDYMVKPFDAGELAARIAAILRRVNPS